MDHWSTLQLRLMSRHPRSIVWRALVANATVFAIAFLLLAVTPVTISAPIRVGELAILAIGVFVLLAVNWVLVRRALAPLQSLAARMEAIDLRRRPVDIPAETSQIREVDAVTAAFGTMIERLAEERRQTSRAVLAGQEGERLRIARELHDEVGQALIALTLRAERAAEGANPADAAEFVGIAEQLRFNLDEVRRIAHELRPETLDDLGLINALISLANSVRAQGGMIVERRLPAEMQDLSPELELVIYRVAQEALNNAARHSGASRAQISLSRDGSEIDLRISDDGCGLGDAAEGIGIEGMRERALLVGGRLELDSATNRGTTVTLSVADAVVA